MLEAKINSYGKDKLKNLAKYKNSHYPIIYQWHDLHTVDPNRKFILYFAMPDDKGNVFVIPSKWCEEIREAENEFDYAFILNDNALEQLKEVGKFKKDGLCQVIGIWHDLPEKDKEKRKFDVFFAILSEEKKIFIIQSTWGQLIVLDKSGKKCYH